MNFAAALKEETTHTYTENGARAKNTTSNALLDLFGTIGSLRNRNDDEVCTLFEKAYQTESLFATKILFYARDIKEGCGERKVFRTLLRYLAINHPEALKENIKYIGYYGRFDDLYSLIGTPLESTMWLEMEIQLHEDMENYSKNRPVSLLAKWIKTPDASSPRTRALGILTANKLGYAVPTFKRVLRTLRKYIDVTECKMSANNWGDIKYPSVPSRAMTLYRNAFERHDTDRFNEFVNKAVSGEVTINSSTLYPYDIIEKVLYNGEDNNVLEAQW